MCSVKVNEKNIVALWKVFSMEKNCLTCSRISEISVLELKDATIEDHVVLRKTLFQQNSSFMLRIPQKQIPKGAEHHIF